MATFAVIDLSNLFHRARHVTMGDPVTKVGMAMHIIFRSLRKLHREFRVDHMVFCIDGGSWRYDVYPAYKASRKLARAEATVAEREESDLFFAAMNDLTNYLDQKTRSTVLHAKGIEGDDFVARWTATHPDDQHIIVSGDSDFIQLLAPNVRIYDGINDRLISQDCVMDLQKKERLEFSINSSSGKLKIGKPNPDYIAEPEWWKKALFVKIVRGDSGDGIFSANPGVRFKGSVKRIGIEEAWEDRHEKGFHWNNFMLQTWDKLLGATEEGEKITKLVRVVDEFHINESLIDLTQQPDDVVAKMDEVIIEAVQRSPAGNRVGIDFLRFCDRFDLPQLLTEATDHVVYLNAPYAKS